MSQETWYFRCFQFSSDSATWFVPGNLTLSAVFSFSLATPLGFCLGKLETSSDFSFIPAFLWLCPRKLYTSNVFNLVLAPPLGLSKETWHLSCLQFSLATPLGFCLGKLETSSDFSFVLATPIGLSQETYHFSCFQFCSCFATGYVPGNFTLQMFSILFWLRHLVCPRKLDTSAVFNFVLATPLGLSQETWHFCCFQFCSDYTSGFVLGNLTLQLFSVLFWHLSLQLLSVLFLLCHWLCPRKLYTSNVFNFVLAPALGLSQETWHFSCFQFCSVYTSGFLPGNLTLLLFSTLFWLRHWVCPRNLVELRLLFSNLNTKYRIYIKIY